MSAIGVIGAGAWGTALAITMARAGHDALLWGRDATRLEAMAAARENSRDLPGLALPATLSPVTDLARVAASPLLVLAVPTQALREMAEAMAPHVGHDVPIVIAAKGIEQNSGEFVDEIVAACVPHASPAILSGPSFASDVARGLPTAVTLAAKSMALAEHLATEAGSAHFRIYHTDDLRGVAIGGAAKNVLAIAAGIVAGVGLGESARAAIVTRGFAELRRFAAAFGARPETLMGLSGLGDLLLTAATPQSRNFALGLALGRGEPLASAGHRKLAEGAFTAPILLAKAKERGVDMPVSACVAAILAGKIGIKEAMTRLTDRPQRSEG